MGDRHKRGPSGRIDDTHGWPRSSGKLWKPLRTIFAASSLNIRMGRRMLVRAWSLSLTNNKSKLRDCHRRNRHRDGQRPGLLLGAHQRLRNWQLRLRADEYPNGALVTHTNGRIGRSPGSPALSQSMKPTPGGQAAA